MSEEEKDAQTNEVNNQTSSYRSIFKATSLFGGVQVYQILIGIIKSKFIAILLGPEGIGLMGLYTSAIDLIKQFSSLGLSQSAVRDVSEANGLGDTHQVSLKITVLQKLVWYTGLLGMVLTILFSPLLSKVTFGNYDYTLPLIILSCTLLFDQLCSGQKVVLQGLLRLKDLAKTISIGSTLGLIVSIPLYYLLGIKGIVPTIILNSITALMLSYIYSKRVPIEHIKVTRRQVMYEGRIMLKMGVAMSVSSIGLVVSSYVLKSFLRFAGGFEVVGVFTAGYVIINSYVNMIFTAMATDFYPRLAAVNKDNDKCREIINKQGEIGALIMGPIMIICIVLMPFIIKILYSEQFIEANDYVIFAALGMMFKFSSVLVAHLFLVKSSARLYIWNETSNIIYTLVLNLLGYYFLGMKGLGLSFLISYIIYLLQVYWQTAKYYDFSFSLSFLKVYIPQLCLVVVSLLVFLIINSNIKYLIALPFIIVSMVLSLTGLNSRINITGFIKTRR